MQNNSPEHPVIREGERCSVGIDKSVCLHSQFVFSGTYWIKTTLMLVSYLKTIKTCILSADLKNSKPAQSRDRELQRQIQLKSNKNKVICNEVQKDPFHYITLSQCNRLSCSVYTVKTIRFSELFHTAQRCHQYVKLKYRNFKYSNKNSFFFLINHK